MKARGGLEDRVVEEGSRVGGPGEGRPAEGMNEIDHCPPDDGVEVHDHDEPNEDVANADAPQPAKKRKKSEAKAKKRRREEKTHLRFI